VVRRERPARETTPISAPALKTLVEGSKPPVVDPDEVPYEVNEDDDAEISVTEDDPAAPRPKFAHVVRRPPPGK
jgi:hypothetical protein